MKLLLDTHILLWAGAGTLPAKAEALIADMDNSLFFSSVSIWEMVIKKSLGCDFSVDPALFRRSLLDNGYKELTVTSLHALAVQDLPAVHKDPFDRMLVAQARCEGISLVTSDARIREYPGPIQFIAK